MGLGLGPLLRATLTRKIIKMHKEDTLLFVMYTVFVVGMTVFVVNIPKILDREAYRRQAVCEWEVSHDYHKGPCDFWKGPRP